MTVHSRRNRKGRTEVDIATEYFEEEKEKTMEILEKKKRQELSKKTTKPSFRIDSSKEILIEKKKKIHPKSEPKQLQRNKNTHQSYHKIRPNKRRTVVKKGRESKKKSKKHVRSQYFQRYDF